MGRVFQSVRRAGSFSSLPVEDLCLWFQVVTRIRPHRQRLVLPLLYRARSLLREVEPTLSCRNRIPPAGQRQMSDHAVLSYLLARLASMKDDFNSMTSKIK